MDVLELIIKRLPLNDCLRIRATCRSCRKTVSNFIEKKRCCHLPELPLVFLESKKSTFYYSLSTKSVCHLRTLLGRTNACVGSVDGWLILCDYSENGFGKFFFLNPITDVRITIPSKLQLPSSAQYDGIVPVRKMVASSKPNCDGSDCYLVGLLSDNCHIAIYKLFDKSWTIVEPDKELGTYFADVEIIGTKLYAAVLSSQSIFVYDLKDSTNGPPAVLAKLPNIRPSESLFNCFCFLAKDEALRELYFIYMFCTSEHEIEHVFSISDHLKVSSSFSKPPQINGFEVYKLDTDKDPPIGWQNVKLEDRVVFLSYCKTMIISRDELNCNEEVIRGNSIYFSFIFPSPIINPQSGLELGMFCLTDGSIKYFSVETSKHGDVPFPSWFVPNLW